MGVALVLGCQIKLCHIPAQVNETLVEHRNEAVGRGKLHDIHQNLFYVLLEILLDDVFAHRFALVFFFVEFLLNRRAYLGKLAFVSNGQVSLLLKNLVAVLDKVFDVYVPCALTAVVLDHREDLSDPGLV